MGASAEVLLREHAWLRGLLAGLLSDPHEVDDVLQDVRIAALTRAPHELRSVRGWLGAVAQRLAVRRRRRARLGAWSEAQAARPEALPSALDVVARVEAHRKVVDAVLALEEPYRSAILMRFFEGRKPSAIAAEAGCPVATVRTRLRRGLLLLRGRLEASLGPRGGWARALGCTVGPGWRAAGSSSSLAGVMGMGMNEKLCAGAALLLLASLSTVAWCVRSPRTDANAGPGAELAAAASTLPQETVGGAAAASGAPAAPARTPVPADEGEARVPDEGSLPAPAAGELVVLVLDEHGSRVVGARVMLNRRKGAETLSTLAHGEQLHTRVKLSTSFELATGSEVQLSGSTLSIAKDSFVTVQVLPQVLRFTEAKHRATAAQEAIQALSAAESVYGSLLHRRPDAEEHFELAGRTGADGTCRIRAAGAVALLAAAAAGSSGVVELDVPAAGAQVVLEVWRACTVRGVVVDAAGQPLPGAEVAAAPREDTFPRARPLRATTDAAGRFTLALDPFGTYELVAECGDARSERLQVAAAPSGSWSVRIRMLGRVALAGDVRDPQGQPCGGAEVHVARVDRDPHADPRAQAFTGSVSTAPDGTFRVLLPATGEFLAVAQHPDWGHSHATPVVIPAGGAPRLGLALTTPSAISGTVRWHDGAPIEGAVVTAQPISTSLAWLDDPSRFVGDAASAAVQEDGSYRLEHLVPHVRYQVACVPDERRPYARAERGPMLPSRQDFVFDREALRGASVRLVAFAPHGEAPADASILVSRRGAGGEWVRGEPQEVAFDASSEAVVDGLEQGATYAIELRASGLGRCRTEPFVAGLDFARALRPVRPGSLVVEVRDGGGRPVLGARVTLRERAPAGLRRDDSVRSTDVLGVARWESVSVLPWSVTASCTGRHSEALPVMIESDRETRIQVELR
jgi:RNA polymerase sigma-70 factor (ECF subfamily)